MAACSESWDTSGKNLASSILTMSREIPWLLACRWYRNKASVPYGGGCAGDKRGPQHKPGDPWQWRNQTQPHLITLMPKELLLVVPFLLNQLLLKHQQAEWKPLTTVSPRKATRSGEREPSALHPRLQEPSWGKRWERKHVGRKGQRRGKKKYTERVTALSHDFTKNWMSSKSSQDLFPQGEKKTKQNPKQNKTNKQTNKTKKKNTSTFSLFSWLEAGANPADIYTRAQPCMRTG